MTATRRGFLLSATSFLAAPAIVRAASLMPVHSWQQEALTPAFGPYTRNGKAFYIQLMTTDQIKRRTPLPIYSAEPVSPGKWLVTTEGRFNI